MYSLVTAGTATHTGCVTGHATETLDGVNEVGEISAYTPMKRIKFSEDVF